MQSNFALLREHYIALLVLRMYTRDRYVWKGQRRSRVTKGHIAFVIRLGNRGRCGLSAKGHPRAARVALALVWDLAVPYKVAVALNWG